MTNTGYWYVTVPYSGHEELFKEIGPSCNEIERVASKTPEWGGWRKVSTGEVCQWKTRLWSLPNHYTVRIRVKPAEAEMVGSVLQ